MKVQRKECRTCIYRKGFDMDLKALEAEVSDGNGKIVDLRICHNSEDAVCAGFWAKHKDTVKESREAQATSIVELVDININDDDEPENPASVV